MSQWRLGLTGGIGSGKSTVARLFAEQGIEILDADEIARQVVAPGMPALTEIACHFGKTLIREDGTLDRGALRSRVFANLTELQWLNALLHPLIRQELEQRAGQASSPYVILMIPLLFENKLQSMVQRTLAVDVSEETQIARVCARDGSSREQIQQILQAQLSREQRLAMADDILDNDTLSIAQLREKVIHLHLNYLAFSARDAG